MFWDYHVVLLCKDDDWRVWDLDTTLGMPVAVDDYLENTFRERTRPELLPLFRIVDADEFVAKFSSDRSHMRKPSGEWQAPPPDWPVIQSGPSNLMQFVDMTEPGPGEVLHLAQLKETLTQ